MRRMSRSFTVSFPFVLLALAVLAPTPYGADIALANSTGEARTTHEFFTLLQNPNITLIELPADLTLQLVDAPDLPIPLTRNVTILGTAFADTSPSQARRAASEAASISNLTALSSSPLPSSIAASVLRLTLLDLAFLWSKIHLELNTVLRFERLQLWRGVSVGITYMDIISRSPGGRVQLVDSLMLRPVCMPLDMISANLRQLPRPPFEEAPNATQGMEIVEHPALCWQTASGAANLATAVAVKTAVAAPAGVGCRAPWLDDWDLSFVTQLPDSAATDSGGYSITYTRMAVGCDSIVSLDCLTTKGADRCIAEELLELQHVYDAAASPPVGAKRSGGLGQRQAVALGLGLGVGIAGLAAVLAGLSVALARRRKRRAGPGGADVGRKGDGATGADGAPEPQDGASVPECDTACTQSKEAPSVHRSASLAAQVRREDTLSSEGLGQVELVRRQITASRPPVNVQMLELIGQGGFGKVYRGVWRGTVVALKVATLPASMTQRERKQQMAVMEAAISSAMNHPNVVQTYDYSFRAVMDGAALSRNAGIGGMPDDGAASCRAAAGQAQPAAVAPAGIGCCTPAGPHGYELQLVLEYCDLGSLRDALERGAFHRGRKPHVSALHALHMAVHGPSPPPSATRQLDRHVPAIMTLEAGPVAGPAQCPGPWGGPAALGLACGAGGTSQEPVAEAAAVLVEPEGGGGAQAEGCAYPGTQPAPSPAPASLDRDNAPATQPPAAYRYKLMLAVASDVASALLHLHSNGIVHGDVKACNVLLKSAAGGRPALANTTSSSLMMSGGMASESRSGLCQSSIDVTMCVDHNTVAKVADFGLAMHMNESSGPHVTSSTAQGTLSHMSPELLLYGHVSKHCDTYAYGIMLYELFTGRTAYKGVKKALLPHQVAIGGLRPEFPPHTPPDYRALAERCWAAGPLGRPSFEEVLLELQAMRRRAEGDGAAVAASRCAGTTGTCTAAEQDEGEWFPMRTPEPSVTSDEFFVGSVLFPFFGMSKDVQSDTRT